MILGNLQKTRIIIKKLGFHTKEGIFLKEFQGRANRQLDPGSPDDRARRVIRMSRWRDLSCRPNPKGDPVRCRFASALLTLALSVMITSAAQADRYVVVNGGRLSPALLSELDVWHCGPVPDGHYWLDLQTGVWGYPGNFMPQGHVADNCGSSGGGGGSSSWNGNYGYGGQDGNGFGYVCTDSGCVSYGE